MDAVDHNNEIASGEADPLHAFSAEPGQPCTYLIAAKGDDAQVCDQQLQNRLERSERQLERVSIDITTLKSDLATLVSAVEDIQRRQSRSTKKLFSVVASLQPQRLAWARKIAAMVVSLAAAATVLLVALATVDLPDAPPTVESPSASVVEPPTPAPVVIQPSPTPLATSVPAVAKASTAAAAPERPPRVMHYVGSLTVDAEPAGDVYIDRHSVGRTPVRVDNLRAGSHLIWIESEGYRRWTRVVPVAASRVSRVSVSLDPLPR
jgi:hypothetical protein